MISSHSIMLLAAVYIYSIWNQYGTCSPACMLQIPLLYAGVTVCACRQQYTAASYMSAHGHICISVAAAWQAAATNWNHMQWACRCDMPLLILRTDCKFSAVAAHGWMNGVWAHCSGQGGCLACLC